MPDLGLLGLVLGTVFLVELPDKTFIATLVLATRYRPTAVWVGVAAAFAVQCLVAVAAGSLIGALPSTAVASVTLLIFTGGALLLIRSARSARSVESAATSQPDGSGTRSFGRDAATAFGVIFAAEWGDLSQLLTVGFVSRSDAPATVFLGAWSALLLVSGLAAATGQVLLRHVRPAVIQYAGAAVCAALAVWTGLGLVRAI